MKQDLTEGNISKQLIRFFLPIAAGTLFQQLYNAADAVIVGKFVGTVALAAVGGSAANITNLVIGFFVALSGGCAVVIAQFFGAKDEERLRRATGTSVAFCVIIGLALSAVGMLLAEQMLVWLRSPAETIADAALYLRVVFAGVTAQLLYNMEAGILRAVGDSRSPFIYLFVCCLTNIVLDLVFVIFFGMGVFGAALATVLSQVLSAVLATVKLCRSREAYRISLKNIRIDRQLLGRMLRIGLPSGFQASMYAASNLILQVAVNLLGTTVVAGWSLASKIDGFYWATSSAAGTAIMNFVAQNFGAGRIDRVKECNKIGMKLFIGVTVLFSAALVGSAKFVLPLFSDDAAVIEATWHVMLYTVPFYFTWTFIEIISGVLRGVGDAIVPVVICGIGICLLRAVWIMTAYRAMPTLMTICASYSISWTVTDIAFLIYYRTGRWQRLAEHRA